MKCVQFKLKRLLPNIHPTFIDITAVLSELASVIPEDLGSVLGLWLFPGPSSSVSTP